MSDANFFKWARQIWRIDLSNMTRLGELEEENRRLKAMYAESGMDCEILREALAKK